MVRRVKDYRVRLRPRELVGKPVGLRIRFRDAHGDLGRYFEFGQFAGHAAMAAELALAFRYQCADKTPNTRSTIFGGVKAWFKFLEGTGSQARCLGDVDSNLLCELIVWMSRTYTAKATRIGLYGGIKQLLSWVKRHRPDLVDPLLEFPYNAFPRPQSDSKQREPYSRSEIEAVLAAARKDIEHNWNVFQNGQAALARVDRRAVEQATDIRNLDLRDLGMLMAVLVDRFQGLVPSQSTLLHSGLRLMRLYRAIAGHGGIRHVERAMYATTDVLTPYLLVLGASLFANPSGLLELRRDSLVDHVLLDGRAVVTWSKGRARRPQRRSFLRGRALSVPNLIEQVLAMTEPLLPHVPEKHRNRLFLAATRHTGKRFVGPYPRETGSSLRKFVARHRLVADSGEPLALTLVRLRVTGLTLAHDTLNGDILKTQKLANHSQPSTTERYIGRAATRRANAASIGLLQHEFVASVRSGELRHVRDTKGVGPIEPRFATASGFTCRDPLSGAAPGQKAGTLCTAWLGCFTCPNAVIPMTADTLARLLAMKEALIGARSQLPWARWKLVYQPKLEILENDILNHFSPELFAEAAALQATVPRPPPIE